MSETVASIFKLLIKVPIIICISFFIFNLFAFAVCYFRLLGASYSLQQIVMENNYLPPKEAKSFISYLDVLDGDNSTSLILNATPIVTTDTKVTDFSAKKLAETKADALKNSTVYGDNKRKQYGNKVTVGVAATFKILVPFTTTQIQGKTVRGVSGKQRELTANERTHQALVTDGKTVGEVYNSEGVGAMISFPIVIQHDIIGLQYYSDLAM